MFKEVTFSYNILSDPDKRRQYDTAGFEVWFYCLNIIKFGSMFLTRIVTSFFNLGVLLIPIVPYVYSYLAIIKIIIIYFLLNENWCLNDHIICLLGC